MPIPTYTPGYPPDGSSLGQTKSTIRNNLDGTFQTLAVDHINNNGQPGTQPAGYHTIIHQVPQVSVATVSGYNQVFSGVPGTLIVNGVTTPAIPSNGDTQLYSLTGQGGLSQLTGNSVAMSGYNWFGGILIQWGRIRPLVSQTTTPQSFNINFPNNCFNVQLTLGNPSSTGNAQTASVRDGSISTSAFSYNYSGGSAYDTIYWLAIGN
jgi:hypothetical protein